MLDEAVKKINAEIEKVNSPYIQFVGGFLINHIRFNPNSAENILQDGKTVTGSFEEMRKVAEKKKVGNCAVLTDEEGFAIVLKYFGIEGTVPTAAPIPKEVITPAAPPKEPEKKASTGFDVKLDDFF